METCQIHTQLDDAVIRTDLQRDTFRVSVCGTWQTDGRSPLFPLLAEYAGSAPHMILDLSALEYNWCDGFLQLLVVGYWREAIDVMVITPPDHPRWVDWLIFDNYQCMIPTGATPGGLTIQCGDYLWHHDEDLDPKFSHVLTQLLNLA